MAKYSVSDGVRGITGQDGYGWKPLDGAWRREDGEAGFTLEKRRRNPKDGTTDTGWYLYSDGPGGFFGEWCGTRILDAVDEANRLIHKAEGASAPKAAPVVHKAPASLPERFVMEFDEGVRVGAPRGAAMVDRLSIRPRGHQDATEFYELPNEPGRMYKLGPTLEERGWRLVSDVEYIAGRRVWAFVERIKPELTDGAIREADVMRQNAARREALGIAGPCVHGTTPRADVQGNPVSACRTMSSGDDFGAFSDEGSFYTYGCAVDVANEAAKENEAAEAPADDPYATWHRICREHEEQPADTCEECYEDENAESEKCGDCAGKGCHWCNWTGIPEE